MFRYSVNEIPKCFAIFIDKIIMLINIINLFNYKSYKIFSRSTYFRKRIKIRKQKINNFRCSVGPSSTLIVCLK